MVMPARLLLGQRSGVDPGERLHEGGLAVVDVAGGADHDVPARRFGRLRHRWRRSQGGRT
jgi:hypothetical protein